MKEYWETNAPPSTRFGLNKWPTDFPKVYEGASNQKFKRSLHSSPTHSPPTQPVSFYVIRNAGCEHYALDTNDGKTLFSEVMNKYMDLNITFKRVSFKQA